jgi:hypothetical protein
MEELENKTEPTEETTPTVTEKTEEVASTIPAHMQRVIVELAELNEKITKLAEFLRTAPSLMSQRELDLLLGQLGYMKGYAATLQFRLDLYGIA